jgi:hypothetical protein
MRWLHSQGGECKTGIGADPVIGMVPVTKLVGPDGRFVVWPGNDQYEILASYTIEYLDTRLGVLSPFASVKRS